MSSSFGFELIRPAKAVAFDGGRQHMGSSVDNCFIEIRRSPKSKDPATVDNIGSFVIRSDELSLEDQFNLKMKPNVSSAVAELIMSIAIPGM